MGRPGSPGLPGPKVGKVRMHMMHYGTEVNALLLENITTLRVASV